ncbi:acetyl-CoA synthetase, partial [Chytriomyces hyalinus]
MAIPTHAVPARLLDESKCPKPHVSSLEQYKQMHQESVENPVGFWRKMAKSNLDWISPFSDDTVMQGSFLDGDIAWFPHGTLNVAYNCIDRHASKHPDSVAMIFEADEPGNHEKITYATLLREVCRFANVLKKYGVRKGDTVAIYMPMVPEAAYAMLACARIGAVH